MKTSNNVKANLSSAPCKNDLSPLGSDVGLDKSRSLTSERKSIRAEEYQDSLAPVSYIQVQVCLMFSI